MIPDRIEAGTFMIAAAITGGELTLRNADIDHLVAFTHLLETCGVDIQHSGTDLIVKGTGRAKPTDTTTWPYPGFPTDLQAQLMTLLSLADGNTWRARSSAVGRRRPARGRRRQLDRADERVVDHGRRLRRRARLRPRRRRAALRVLLVPRAREIVTLAPTRRGDHRALFWGLLRPRCRCSTSCFTSVGTACSRC